MDAGLFSESQKERLREILRGARPGLVFPWPQLWKLCGLRAHYDPEVISKAIAQVRRKLRKDGYTYLCSREAIWKSSAK